MSIQAFHHEEFFLDSGNMHGNSATSAIGRPSLESWDLFTRETLQNSWDARDRTSHDDGVTFSIDYRELSGHRAEALREFFGEGTQGLDSLGSFLAGDKTPPLPILVVSDTGTAGLQGPTSAAQHYEGRDDFVSFVRNIGRRAEKEIRGGTYGFGKGVFFNMSDAQTVLIYSRTKDENGSPVRRFIAMANSNGYSRGEYNFTGRHWWGQEAHGITNNIYANPFTGADADSLARTFLMDLHFTDDRPTGTSIAVVNPQIDEDEVDQVMTTISNALTKWAWPHMVHQLEDMDPIDFSVTVNGRDVPIPDPQRDPLLKPFVRAYRTALKEPEHIARAQFKTEFQQSGPNRWVDIVSARPHEYLGRLAVREVESEVIPQHSVLAEGMTNHVALIRGPRMIVNYWQGPKASPEDSYAGVFVAAKHLDAIFAASEPPAHDEWNPSTVNLKDPRFFRDGNPRAVNPVRVAMRRLQDQLKNTGTSIVETDSTRDVSGLSAVSNALGTIMPGATGTSTRVSKPKPAPKPSQAPTSKLRGVKTGISLSGLHPTDKGTMALFKISVETSPKVLADGVRIGVQTAVLVDGKRQSEEKDGLEMPTALGWLAPHELTGDLNLVVRRVLPENELFRVMRSETWEGYYAVLQPADAAITADVTVEIDTEEGGE